MISIQYVLKYSAICVRVYVLKLSSDSHRKRNGHILYPLSFLLWINRCLCMCACVPVSLIQNKNGYVCIEMYTNQFWNGSTARQPASSNNNLRGTISFKHLKENLLSGNYDKYHLPLFLRRKKNANINFMSYASRYDSFFFLFSFIRFSSHSIVAYFSTCSYSLSISFRLVFYFVFAFKRLAYNKKCFGPLYDTAAMESQCNNKTYGPSNEAKGFSFYYSVIRWHIWL